MDSSDTYNNCKTCSKFDCASNCEGYFNFDSWGRLTQCAGTCVECGAEYNYIACRNRATTNKWPCERTINCHYHRYINSKIKP